MRKIFSAIVLAGLLVLVGCSAASPEDAGMESTQPASEGPSKEQLAALIPVDVTTEATGASIHELITIDDIKKIIGRDDIVFAEAT